MKFGQIVLVVYGLVVAAGGSAAYFSKGSVPSIVAGCAIGGFCLAAFFLSRVRLAPGYRAGTAVIALSVAVFIWRVVKAVRADTFKFMPSGMLLALGLVALVLIVVASKRDLK